MFLIYAASYLFSESDMEPVMDEENREEAIKNNTPANEKNTNYYQKDIKQCKSLKLIAVHIQKLIIWV